MNNKIIEARSGFYSAHQMDIYKIIKTKVNYINSKSISSSIVTLPSSVSLKNREINYICKPQLNLFLNKSVPPSITKLIPVIYELSSEPKKK